MSDQKTILIVEDETLLANLLKQRLLKDGFNAIVANDGDEALNILHKTTPDLMLFDVILPKMSGFEVIEKIKSDPQLEKIPVIIISNLGQESDIKRGQDLGAVGYFIKAQISIEDLVEKIKGFLATV